MKRLLTIAASAALAGAATFGVTTAVQNQRAEHRMTAPIGTRLQSAAGPAYEVIYSTVTGVYSVEQTCNEDEPCWDWRTMGNLAHGVCHDGHLFIEYADGNVDATHDEC